MRNGAERSEMKPADRDLSRCFTIFTDYHRQRTPVLSLGFAET